MTKGEQLTVRLEADISARLAAISVAEGRSQGELVRRAVRAQYGIEPPGQTLAAALAADAGGANPHLDAPRLNGEGGAGHG